MKKRLKKKMDKNKVFTLQDAWDMVCDHLDENKDNISCTYFVNNLGFSNQIKIERATGVPLLVSTKKYR